MRISDWSSDVCSSDLVAETEADATDPFGAFAAQPVDRRLDILDPVVGIILAEIAERLLKFGLDIGAALHPGREAAEDVGRDCEIASGRTVATFLADAFVDAADFRSEAHTSTLQSLISIP